MEEESKFFHQVLLKENRKSFHKMFRVAHMSNYAAMMSMPQQPVMIQPITTKIVFHHYKKVMKTMECLKRKLSQPSCWLLFMAVPHLLQ
jgi:hypothetical protein